jgi:glycosyltransferase involved in cell wall biosynthesis
MLLGVPVISTDAGGLPEVLEGDAGLICAREDPAALARAVRTVLEEPPLRQRLVSTARVKVQRFSSDRMAEGMLTVYHSVARAT